MYQIASKSISAFDLAGISVRTPGKCCIFVIKIMLLYTIMCVRVKLSKGFILFCNYKHWYQYVIICMLSYACESATLQERIHLFSFYMSNTRLSLEINTYQIFQPGCPEVWLLCTNMLCSAKTCRDSMLNSEILCAAINFRD